MNEDAGDRDGARPAATGPPPAGQGAVGRFYAGYHDHIAEKRFDSPFWLRRYAHRAIHELIARHVVPGTAVLDAGCGEGTLSCLLARSGARVTGIDISVPNVGAARERARDEGLDIRFVVGEGERLPFPDDSFDLVVSSHVIEHLPDPVRGLQELYRVSRRNAIVAMPTCLNPAAWALLGGDSYWKLTCRSAWAVPCGLARTMGALVLGREGVDEGYAGRTDLPHVWRFPWVVAAMVRDAGFQVGAVEAGPLILPYAAESGRRCAGSSRGSTGRGPGP